MVVMAMRSHEATEPRSFEAERQNRNKLRIADCQVPEARNVKAQDKVLGMETHIEFKSRRDDI